MLQAVSSATVVKDIGMGIGIASLGIGGVYVGYKIGKALYDWGDDIVDSVKNTPIGIYGRGVSMSDGKILPPGVSGIYKLFSWLTTPVEKSN